MFDPNTLFFPFWNSNILNVNSFLLFTLTKSPSYKTLPLLNSGNFYTEEQLALNQENFDLHADN